MHKVALWATPTASYLTGLPVYLAIRTVGAFAEPRDRTKRLMTPTAYHLWFGSSRYERKRTAFRDQGEQLPYMISSPRRPSVLTCEQVWFPHTTPIEEPQQRLLRARVGPARCCRWMLTTE